MWRATGKAPDLSSRLQLLRVALNEVKGWVSLLYPP
jgi:hypothetical protein